MSAGKTHTMYHVAPVEPTEMMELAVVLEDRGSSDMFLICLDSLTMTSWAFCVGFRL